MKNIEESTESQFWIQRICHFFEFYNNESTLRQGK